MAAIETIKAAYAAFGRNDPSVLFAARDSALAGTSGGQSACRSQSLRWSTSRGRWCVRAAALAIDDFTAVPSTFIDGGDHVVVLGRYGGTMKNGGAPLDSPFCHVYRFHGDKAVMFQQYTDTAQWKRLMT